MRGFTAPQQISRWSDCDLGSFQALHPPTRNVRAGVLNHASREQRMRPETSHPTSRGPRGDQVSRCHTARSQPTCRQGVKGPQGGEEPAVWKPLQPPPHRSRMSWASPQQVGRPMVCSQGRCFTPRGNPLSVCSETSLACVSAERAHVPSPSAHMEDSRQSLESAVNGFYK